MPAEVAGTDRGHETRSQQRNQQITKQVRRSRLFFSDCIVVDLNGWKERANKFPRERRIFRKNDKTMQLLHS